MPRLALFDLDHTLIPFDSGMAWTRFLTSLGALPDDAPQAYLATCQGYVDGRLDIRALHRATVSALRKVPPAQIDEWALAFEAEMAPRLPEPMKALVREHRAAGDLCALVTATSRFIAEPFGRLFDLPHVLATESARDAENRLTGEILGEPCFREHKVSHVEVWLGLQSLSLASFDQSFFYSDSFNDMPLLEAVTQPAAVRPDARLRAHAAGAGWRIIEP